MGICSSNKYVEDVKDGSFSGKKKRKSKVPFCRKNSSNEIDGEAVSTYTAPEKANNGSASDKQEKDSDSKDSLCRHPVLGKEGINKLFKEVRQLKVTEEARTGKKAANYPNSKEEVDTELQEMIKFANIVKSGYKINQGNEKYRNGKSNEALVLYEEAMTLDPDNMAIYRSRGLVWGQLGEYQKAVSDLTVFIDSFPSNDDSYHIRGLMYRAMGSFEKALNDYEKALEFDADNEKVLKEIETTRKEINERGTTVITEVDIFLWILEPEEISRIFSEHNYESTWDITIEELIQKVDHRKRYPTTTKICSKYVFINDQILEFSNLTSFEISESYVLLRISSPKMMMFLTSVNDDEKEWMIYLLKAADNRFRRRTIRSRLECDWDEVHRLYMSGFANFGQRRLKETICDLQECLKINRNYGDAYTLLGNAYFQDNQITKAIEILNKSVLMNDGLVANDFVTRGQSYNLLHKYTLAEKDFEIYSRLTKDVSGDGYYLWGTCLVRLNRTEKAIEKFTRSIDINLKKGKEDVFAPTYSRGMCYLRRNEFHEAIQDFTTVLRAREGDWKTLLHRGIGYFGLKNEYDSAIDDLNRCIELNPRCKEAYTYRFKAYHSNGDFEKSETDFLTVQKIFGGLKEEEDINNIGRFAFLVTQNQDCIYDAQRMKGKLEPMGYECFVSTNVSCQEFYAELEEFIEIVERSEKKGEKSKIFFYYSGQYAQKIEDDMYWLICDTGKRHVDVSELLERLDSINIQNYEVNMVIDAYYYYCRSINRPVEDKKRFDWSTVLTKLENKSFIVGFSSGEKKSIYTREILPCIKPHKPFVLILNEAGRRMKSSSLNNGLRRKNKKYQKSCVNFSSNVDLIYSVL